jgi:hypothetical protein
LPCTSIFNVLLLKEMAIVPWPSSAICR